MGEEAQRKKGGGCQFYDARGKLIHEWTQDKESFDREMRAEWPVSPEMSWRAVWRGLVRSA